MVILNKILVKNNEISLNNNGKRHRRHRPHNSDINIYYKFICNLSKNTPYELVKNKVSTSIENTINSFNVDNKNLSFSIFLEWDYYEPPFHDRYLKELNEKIINNDTDIFVKGFSLKAEAMSKHNLDDFLLDAFTFFQVLNDCFEKESFVKNFSLFMGILAKEKINKDIFEQLHNKMLNNIKLKNTPRRLTVLSIPIKKLSNVSDVINALPGVP